MLCISMPPTSKKLTGYIGFGLCVRASVRLSVRSSRTVHARVLKFHIWISHGKIAGPYFFSGPSCFLELYRFEKSQNETLSSKTI